MRSLIPSLSCFGLELKVKTSLTDTFGGQTAVRWAGRARLFAQGGVFKQDLTGKMFGTSQNCSFKRGVRLSRVFVRRGSTVFLSATQSVITSIHNFKKGRVRRTWYLFRYDYDVMKLFR